MVFTFQTQGFMSYHRLEQERKREMKIAVQKHWMSASSFLMSNPLCKDAANQPGAETKITKRTHIQRATREINDPDLPTQTANANMTILLTDTF